MEEPVTRPVTNPFQALLIIWVAIGIVIASAVYANAAEGCVIIYAKDQGSAVTREIRNHELAHCNGWEHDEGRATGFKKAFQPPKRFLRAYRGNVYETPVTTNEAKARCNGHLGCFQTFHE